MITKIMRVLVSLLDTGAYVIYIVLVPCITRRLMSIINVFVQLLIYDIDLVNNNGQTCEILLHQFVGYQWKDR